MDIIYDEVFNPYKQIFSGKKRFFFQSYQDLKSSICNKKHSRSLPSLKLDMDKTIRAWLQLNIIKTALYN